MGDSAYPASWYAATRDAGADRPPLAVRIDADVAIVGGGFAGLEVGPWSVRCAFGSRAIADAARELEKLPGLTVVRHAGYDV